MSDKQVKCSVCGRPAPLHSNSKSVGPHMLNDYMCRGSGAEITDPEFLAQWRRENCVQIVKAAPGWVHKFMVVFLSNGNVVEVFSLRGKEILDFDISELEVSADRFSVRIVAEDLTIPLWEILGIPEPKP